MITRRCKSSVNASQRFSVDRMSNYDLHGLLSPIDFELLTRDLLEAELGFPFENFKDGKDKGIDLRYAPAVQNVAETGSAAIDVDRTAQIIVQCKRHKDFAQLRRELERNELPKIRALNPARYLLATTVRLSPQQADQIRGILTPYVNSTADIYGHERINVLLVKHAHVEKRHLKLWIHSTAVMSALFNADTLIASHEEVDRSRSAARLYVRNQSFDDALTILNNHHVCIIAGLPGIGKTTLARMLLLHYLARGFDIVKIEHDIGEARRLGYDGRRRFYYYDDFLGQTASADKLNKNEDQKLIDFMASVQKSKASVFVLTTREYVLNQAKLNYEKLARERFDYRMCIIDLSKYTRRIKAQILYNHLHFSDLDSTYVRELVRSRRYIQIVDHRNYNPRLIEYLTSNTWVGGVAAIEYPKLFLETLNNPIALWDHAFRNQLSKQSQNLLLVYTTLPEDCPYAEVLQAFSAFHSASSGHVSATKNADDFRYALKELDGTFLAYRNVGGTSLIRFQNPSIRDFMQTLIFGGEALTVLLGSIVYFEQAQWLSNSLVDEQKRIVRPRIVDASESIAERLIATIDAESCVFSVYGSEPNQYLSRSRVRTIRRMQLIARFIRSTSQSDQKYKRWFESRMEDVVFKVADRTMAIEDVEEALSILSGFGNQLEALQGSFVLAVKNRLFQSLDELGDFELLLSMNSKVRDFLSQDEIAQLREVFSGFASDFSRDPGVDDPDEIRSECSRLSRIGTQLWVDISDEERRLIEAADDLERERGQEEEEEDRGYIAHDGDLISDNDLHSLFGTL